MTRRQVRQYPANVFLVWSGLALKTGEMLMASAQVIGLRTSRIAMAGAIPSARDQREFALMGQEKLEAVAESAQAIAARVLRLNQEISTLAFKQIMTGTSGMLSIATSSTMVQTSRLQGQLLRDTVANSTEVVSQLTGSVARVADKGLKPIHSRATANARRLARIK